jgi:hypothetical protein
MPFNLVLILVIMVIGAVTTLGFYVTLTLLKGVACRLKKLKPGCVTKEDPKKNKILGVLNSMLVTSLSLSSLALGLGSTILNPDFVAGEVSKLDITALARELVSEQTIDQLLDTANQILPVQLVARLDGIKPELASGKVSDLTLEQQYGAESIQATLAEYGPVLRENVQAAVYSFYDFVFGKESDIEVVISLGTLQEGLKRNLDAAVMKSPPPELTQASTEQLQSYADSVYQRQFESVPAELALSLKTSNERAVATFNSLRQIAANIPLFRNLLLSLNLLLIAGIILVYRDFKSALWTLGIAFFITGAMNIFYVFIGQAVSSQTQALMGLPSINVWLIQLIADVFASIKQPGLVLFRVGAGMFAVAFLLILFSRAAKPKPIEQTCK